MFSPTKTTTGSNKTDDWLGLKDESSDEDEFPTHTTRKSEPVVTAPVKKTQKLAEPPKKSVLDGLLDDDRRALSEKITPPIKVSTPKITPDFLFEDRTSSNIRRTSAGMSRSPLFGDSHELKSSTTKSSYDQRNAFGIEFFFAIVFGKT